MQGTHDQHQRRGNNQASGSVQYVPRSEDTDMSFKGTNTNENSAAVAVSDNTNTQQQQPKETEKIAFNVGMQEFILKASDFTTKDKGATGDPLNDLTYKLEGKVTLLGRPSIRYLQIKSPETEKYLSVKLSDERSKKYLLNLLFSKDIVVTTPGEPDKTVTVTTRFEPYEDHQVAENRGRQIEISSLMSNTTKAKIEGVFNPMGKVEHIRLSPNKYGGLSTATVTFATDDQVKDLQLRQQAVAFFGTDSGRITRRGNEDVIFHKDLVRKLTNLPRGTTPLMLKGLCEKVNNCSVTIPFHRNSTFRKREAFFSFTTQEAFDTLTSREYYLEKGDPFMTWVDVETKLCNECGSPNHLFAACPEMNKRKEQRERNIARARAYRAPAPPTNNKNRYNGAVPKVQTVTQLNQVGVTYSAQAKQGLQENNKQNKGTQPAQVSGNNQQPSYNDLLLMIQKQDAIIRELQEQNKMRVAAENRERIVGEEKETQMISMEERIGQAVANAVATAMEKSRIQMQGEMYCAYKMLKESMAPEKDNEAREENKKRKQPTRGAVAAAVEPQIKETQNNNSEPFDSFQQFQLTISQQMSQIGSGEDNQSSENAKEKERIPGPNSNSQTPNSHSL